MQNTLMPHQYYISHTTHYTTHNQVWAHMKFLPDTDIRYFHNLKSGTQYRYLKWHILKLPLSVKKQKLKLKMYFIHYAINISMRHSHININLSL